MPPHDHDGTLSGISCSSVAFCVALGNEGDNLGMIDTWEDGTWTSVEAPLPADVPDGSGIRMSAVSCRADGACVIVGSANFPPSVTETIPFIDTLSDGTWTSIDAPVPADAVPDGPYDGPTSVSCPAAGSCVAVGRYHYDASDLAGLIDTLSQGNWTAQAAPSPPADQELGLDLDSVACPAVGWCESIGEDGTAAGPGDGVIESLADGSWTVTEAPVPEGPPRATAALLSLACPAEGSCEIVGAFNPTGGAIAEDLTDGTWTPTTIDVNELSAVTCPAVESCMAVGATGPEVGEAYLPVVAGLADGTWTPTTAPFPSNAAVDLGPGNPSGYLPASLSSVSCATLDSCVALGQYEVPFPGSSVGESENLIETLGLGAAQTPVISGTDAVTFTVGQESSVTVTAGGPTTPVLSEKGRLPKGLHFKKGRGTATITGKPAKEAGNFSLTITATSKSTNERIGQPFLVTVNS